MIENGLNCHKNTVNVIMNKTLYSQYGNTGVLQKFGRG